VVNVRLRARERVVVHVHSPAARWISSLALLSVFGWLILMLFHDHREPDWVLTIFVAVAFIARGIFLGRPVTAAHAWMALALLVACFAARVLFIEAFGNAFMIAAGVALMWPTAARPNPADRAKVWDLVSATTGDPVAPFVMQATKCHHFNSDGTAAIAYRTRCGYAVVSGDPIGDEAQFPDLVRDFVGTCHAWGWRIVVLGCSHRRLGLWSDVAVIGQVLRPVPIGRDVVIDVAGFDMVGRRFRNLRQAVQRTRNSGVTTEIVAEQGLDPDLLVELTEVLLASPSGARTERGFSMILDGALEGRHPGIQLIIARDEHGRVQGFHRYATAGRGSDVTLDVPWRRRGAPNGIDERLTVDMIGAAKQQGAVRLSLAFAAFPEIFDDGNRSWIRSLFYTAIHLGDALIALESLYRYLRKFHALGDRRYVLLSLTQVVPLLVVLLSLEFMPRRRHLTG
jgi:lysylphosphatidylglycerol synthetase-like protein (DUF2156 family)